jgi:GT2 family glycosyltransferase
MKPKLAVVIVNYRTCELAIDCLRSLVGNGVAPAGARVIVVDGGSGDHSVGKIAATIESENWSEHVSLLPLAINGGFSYANNRGIEYVFSHFGEPEYVLLLNPDTIVRPGGLAPLIDFMDSNPAAGIAGSRLEDTDGTPQACAFRFPSILAEFESQVCLGPVSRLLRRWRITPDVAGEPVAVDWVSGASMIIRTKLFHEIGMLDERYFLYYEEVDFCMRAARAKWKCWHVPVSRVVHFVGQSTGVTVRTAALPRRPAYWFHSRRRYFVKNHGLLYSAGADLGWLAGHLICRLRQAVQGKASSGPPRLLQDFIRHSGVARRGLGTEG